MTRRTRTKLTSRIEEAMMRLEGDDPERTKATLLIVDDEKGPRESLRMILSPQHRVLVAEDGAQALAVLEREHVDAITVDLNMPGMKGDVLMRRVRKLYPKIEVVVITGYSSVESAVDGLRLGIFDYLTKPFDVVQVSNTVRRALARRDSRHRLVDFLRGIGEVLGEDCDPQAAISELAERPELQARLRDAIARTHGPDDESDAPRTQDERDDDLLRILSNAVESRDPQRAGHAQRVAFLTGLLAERIGLTEVRREEVRVASFLHDLGRVAQMTRHGESAPSADAEDRHGPIGADIIEPLGYSNRIALAVRHHHEHFDGSGRPDGLRGEEIPLAARLIAVADAFDRLTQDAPGRDRLSANEAISALRDQSGIELDPDLLKELIVLAEQGDSSSGPLLGMCFETGDDPVDTIASATAWLEVDR